MKREQEVRAQPHKDRASHKLKAGALYECYWWRFDEGQLRRRQIDSEFESEGDLRPMWEHSEAQKSRVVERLSENLSLGFS